jgi:hypothetical protein
MVPIGELGPYSEENVDTFHNEEIKIEIFTLI